MKRGFTLLELVVVIIIIGILATLGLTQYGRMVERSRGAEARTILGDIRKWAFAYYMERGTVLNVSTGAVNISAAVGGNLDQIPGGCRSSHYFSYGTVNTGANEVVIFANRCMANGKNPDAPGGTNWALSLQANFATGRDTLWGQY